MEAEAYKLQKISQKKSTKIKNRNLGMKVNIQNLKWHDEITNSQAANTTNMKFRRTHKFLLINCLIYS